jgi:hypothetical protein
VKTCNLLAAIVVQHAALHEAGTEREERRERLPGAVEVGAAPLSSSFLDPDQKGTLA